MSARHTIKNFKKPVLHGHLNFRKKALKHMYTQNMHTLYKQKYNRHTHMHTPTHTHTHIQDFFSKEEF